MANRFVRQARNGGDRGLWADFENTQNRLGLPTLSTYLYLSGGVLYHSTGIVGLDDDSDVGNCVFDTVLTLSVAALTNSEWAKVELSRTNTSINISLTSIAGANDPTSLPTSFTGAYDGGKGGYYIQADRRVLGLAWINAGGNLEGIVNCLNGQSYAGYSQSDDAYDVPYYYLNMKNNLIPSQDDTEYMAQSGVFTSGITHKENVNLITTAAASFAGNIPPAASWAGREILLIKIDTGAGICTGTPNGAETFQGATAFPLRNQWDFIKLKSTGTSILVIDSLSTLDSAALAVSQYQTLAHGMGIRPRNVQCRLLCATAELGFIIDDENSGGPNYQAGVPIYRWTYNIDTTNIYTATETHALVVHRKDTGAAVQITMANWKFRIRYGI